MYLLLGLQIAALVALVLTYIYLERNNQATYFDVATIFIPGLLWLSLMVSGILPKSIANLVVEPMVLFPIIVTLLIFRTFLLSTMSNFNRSRAALFSGILVGIALYVFVPALPE